MILKEYIKNLQKYAKEYDAMDHEVYYSIDSEGNAYNPVFFGPSPGYVNENNVFDMCEGTSPPNNKPNAVCIN